MPFGDMGKNRNRNWNRAQDSGNNWPGVASVVPSGFRDQPPPNPLYPDSLPAGRSETMGENKNETFALPNKPPWQRNRDEPRMEDRNAPGQWDREQQPLEWLDRAQELFRSQRRNDMGEPDWGNKVPGQGESRAVEPTFRNRPLEQNSMIDNLRGKNWDDDLRRRNDPILPNNQGSMGPNWNDGPQGSGQNWNDRTDGGRGPSRSNWDDELQRPNWEGGSREPANLWDDGPRVGLMGSNWNDGPRDSQGPNWDDRSRGPSGPNWEERPQDSNRSGWNDGPKALMDLSWNRTPEDNNWSDRRREMEDEWRNRAYGPQRSDRNRDVDGPGWLDRGQSFDRRDRMNQEMSEHERRSRAWDAAWEEQRARWARDHSPNRRSRDLGNKRSRSPERNVWNRLNAPDGWAKRARLMDRPMNAGGIGEDVHAMIERERRDLSTRHDSMQPGLDLRDKLRRDRPNKVNGMLSRDVLVCPRVFRRKFQVKDLEIVKKSLITKLYEMANSDDIEKMPQVRIKNVKLQSRRRIVIECEDDATVKWVLGWYPVGLKLRCRVILPSDPQNLSRIAFLTKGRCEETPESLKLILRIQNPGLMIDAWKNGQNSQTKKGQAYSYVVDGQTTRYLEAHKWELYYEMQKLIVRRIRTNAPL